MKRVLKILLGLLMISAPFFLVLLAVNGGHVKAALMGFAECVLIVAALFSVVGVIATGMDLIIGGRVTSP